MSLSPDTDRATALAARQMGVDAAFESRRLAVKVSKLEADLAEAQARTRWEQAQAKRAAAAQARDTIVARFRAEYDECATGLVALLHLATEAEAACRAANIPGPGLKELCDIVRLPALTNPLH